MASTLTVFINQLAVLARAAAASLDDIAAVAGQASTKALGMVVDDAAVTPKYMAGIPAKREMPMIWEITKGSLKNKLIYLMPLALLLAWLAPGAIMPLLMIGGAYLVVEGAGKVLNRIRPPNPDTQKANREAHVDPDVLEEDRVQAAIRTDFILSAEIMAVTLATVASYGIWMQVAVLAAVGFVMTAFVYGAVAVIVRADDLGARLAKSGSGLLRGIGNALLKGMPVFLKALAIVGTAAMLWVGGSILIHGLASLGVHAPEHWMEAATNTAMGAAPFAKSFAGWLAGAAVSGALGLAVGLLLLVPAKVVLRQLKPKPVARAQPSVA